MPVVNNSDDGALVGSGSSTPSVPRAVRGKYHFEGNYGIPRYQSILSTRSLEKTHTIQIPMDSVLKQVTTMDWNIVPDTDNPSELHWNVADHIEEWLKGNFNANNQTFDQFLKEWVRDILSINSGVVELVPTEPDDNGNQYLGEMYVRDGGRFTRAMDDHGRLPQPPEEAYYQHGRVGYRTERFDRDNPLIDLIKEEAWHRRFQPTMEPKGFTSDQIVWAEENPMSWEPYGMGRVQVISDVVEIILNQDVTNTKYFTSNDVPEGMLQLVDAEQDKVERFREDWKDNIASKKHKMAIVGGDVDWTRFRASPEELQFLESQQWYHKLVWMAFGVGPNEVGETGDLNLATAKEQSATIFRKTTKPLARLVQNEMNTEILPKRREYNIINGEIRFEFDFHNEAVERREREKQQSDLNNNLVTINEVRKDRGDEEVFWGDMPVETYKQMARNHPEWLAENLGYDDVPEPTSGGGLFNDPDGGGKTARTNPCCRNVDPSWSVHEPTWDDTAPEAEWNAPDCGDYEDHGEYANSALAFDADSPEDVETCDEVAYPVVSTEGTLFLDALESSHSLAQGEDDDEVAEMAADIADRVFDVDLGQEDSSVQDFRTRDEPRPDSDQFPDHDQEFSALKRTTATVFQNAVDDLSDELEDRWPNTQGVSDSVQISDDLEGPMLEQSLEAMDTSAEAEADRLEDEVEQALDVHPSDVQDINIDFDVKDTFAARIMEQRVRRDAASIESTVGEMLERAVEGADSVDEAKEFLQEKGDEIADGHAETVARTQILSASREGSQALAESSDVVGGKEWNATDDGRTRDWHAAMDGVIVSTDEDFEVPAVGDAPSEYPKRTFVVGNDQPYNCRCHQQAVLAEDITDNVTETDRVELNITERQYEFWCEHHEDGESFVDTFARMVDEIPASEFGERNILSTSTLYNWKDDYL